MKTNRHNLHTSLKQLAKVVCREMSNQLFSHVLLWAAEDDMLRLRTTSLRTTLTCDIPCDGELYTALPIKQLVNLTKPVGKGKAAKAEVVEIVATTGAAIVTVGDASYTLATMNPSDFPVVASGEYEQVGAWQSSALSAVLGYTLPAMSTDDTRRHLRCIRFEGERACATDGHRMHVASLLPAIDREVLLPSAAATVLAGLVKNETDVTLMCMDSAGRIRVKVGNWQLDATSVDAQYPPIDQVIPRESATKVGLDAAIVASLVAQLSRVDKSKNVTALLNGKLELSIDDANNGSSTVEVPMLTNDHTGEVLAIGFNPRYMLESLPKSGDIVVGFNEALDPIKVTLDNGMFAVIMPTRL